MNEAQSNALFDAVEAALSRDRAEGRSGYGEVFLRAARRLGALTPAAVLVALRAPPGGALRLDDLEVVLTRRVDHLRHHAGQVSFPGGRVDATDENVMVAALREAHEEIALPPEHPRVLGRLRNFPTITRFSVTPIVAAIDGAQPLLANPAEVDTVFAVPLAFFSDDSNARLEERKFAGEYLRFYSYDYEGQRIWGATATMIRELIRVLSQ